MLPSRTNAFVDALVRPSNNKNEIKRSNLEEDAIVIVAGCRSAITKAKKGGLANLKADQLLAAVLKELVTRVKNVPLDALGECCVGTCLQPGGGQAMARMAAFEAGLPYTMPVQSINRQCSSGLQSIATVAGGLTQKSYQFGIAAGVESMSSCSFEDATPIVDWTSVKKSSLAGACMIPMGITSENISKIYNISRREQDLYAQESHRRASEYRKTKTNIHSHSQVRKNNKDDEIIAINGIDEDDSIRENCPINGLSKLKPAFQKNGTTTAGNSSPLSDGASAILITTEKNRKLYNLSCLAIWRHYVVVGVPPDIMGVGPAFAIPELLKQCNISVEDISVFEINEAFSSQVIFCIEYLGLDRLKVNPNGGAIAIGHPLGCSGNRLVLKCANYLKSNGYRYGVVSLCVGTGMGAAALIENPDYFKDIVRSKL
jgi:acetyl-CoA acyltransferase 1